MEGEPEIVTREPEKAGRPCKRRCKNFRRYFYDFLVVVCGIAVTFMVNGWINSAREKKVVKSHLEAVRMELVDNMEYLGERIGYYGRMTRFGEYLRSRKREEHHIDSVMAAAYYREGVTVLETFSNLRIESSAFEAMKSSGALNLLRDQELMRALMKAYADMAETKAGIDALEARRIELVNKYPSDADPDTFGQTDILHPDQTELYLFYSNPFRLELTLAELAAVLEDTLSLF